MKFRHEMKHILEMFSDPGPIHTGARIVFGVLDKLGRKSEIRYKHVWRISDLRRNYV